MISVVKRKPQNQYNRTNVEIATKKTCRHINETFFTGYTGNCNFEKKIATVHKQN